MDLLAPIAILFLAAAALGELAYPCDVYHKYYFAPCIQREYDKQASKRQADFRNRVTKCFKDLKCDTPNLGANILAESVTKTLDRQIVQKSSRLNCVQPKLHDAETWLMSQCRKNKNGKSADDLMNIKDDLKDQLKYFYDSLAIAKAKRKCPAAAVCITKAYEQVEADSCAAMSTCYTHLQYKDCRAQYEEFKDDTCPCLATVKAARATRTTPIGQPPATPAPAGDIIKQLTQIISNNPKLFRVKRQDAAAGLSSILSKIIPSGTGGSTGTGANGLLDIFKNLGAGTAEPKLDAFGADYALNNNEVNATFTKCGVKSIAFGATFEDEIEIACKCDRLAAQPTRTKCLTSSDCLGSENYALVNEALTLYNLLDFDHLRFFCQCEQPKS